MAVTGRPLARVAALGLAGLVVVIGAFSLGPGLLLTLESSAGPRVVSPITRQIVFGVSTWRERALVFIAATIFVATLRYIASRYMPRIAGALLLFGGSLAAFWATYWFLGYAGGAWYLPVLSAVTTAEWALDRPNAESLHRHSVLRRSAIVLLVAMVFAVRVPFQGAARLDRSLFRDAAVRMVASGDASNLAAGDFGWIAFDRRRHLLYACGGGLQRMVAFDVSRPGARPLPSDADSARAQNCAFDADRDELYVYNRDRRVLFYLAGGTLAETKSATFDLTDQGETYISSLPLRGMLVVADENDPTAFVDRDSGRVLSWASFGGGAASILANPVNASVYVNYFRGSRDLVKYDVQKGAIAARVSIDAMTDKMMLDQARRHLLVPSSLRG